MWLLPLALVLLSAGPHARAILHGKPRILITMAMGTGKTFVAVQIVWKLWETERKRRILYLVDRSILVDQPLTREFSIFGDAVWKIQGEAKKGREIYFALYQALAEDESRPGLYNETKDFERLVSLLSRTELVAHHLTAYLKRIDRFAKTMVFCVDQEHAEESRPSRSGALTSPRWPKPPDCRTPIRSTFSYTWRGMPRSVPDENGLIGSERSGRISGIGTRPRLALSSRTCWTSTPTMVSPNSTTSKSLKCHHSPSAEPRSKSLTYSAAQPNYDGQLQNSSQSSMDKVFIAQR